MASRLLEILREQGKIHQVHARLQMLLSRYDVWKLSKFICTSKPAQPAAETQTEKNKWLQGVALLSQPS